MLQEIKVPALAESIADATLLDWQKQAGEFVKRGETLVELETDKVTLEVSALEDGILKEIVRQAGDTVLTDEILAIVDTDASSPAGTDTAANEASTASPANADQKNTSAAPTSPAVRKIVAENALELDQIKGSGKAGRISKTDLIKHLKTDQSENVSANTPPAVPAPVNSPVGTREDRRVGMSRLRQRAADRLVSAQQENAILTTFNEINLQPVKQLRAKLQPQFEKKYGYKLGFMPFFVKASINALKEFPSLNASVDGTDIVYHDYYDIGIAVSAPRGLVVPVMRDVDQLSFSAIEGAIRDLGNKARSSTLTLEDLTGGTFTITNGGVFGSMLSTPIINPPQSAILGMHAISDRPVAEDGQVVIRPVMYVALSYDHRIIDGREAVSFLVSIKKQLEDPALLFIGDL